MDGHSVSHLVYDEMESSSGPHGYTSAPSSEVLSFLANGSEEQRQRYLIETGAIAPPSEPEPSVGLFQQSDVPRRERDYREPDEPIEQRVHRFTPEDLYAAVQFTAQPQPIPVFDTGPALPLTHGLAARKEAVPNRAARRRAQRRHRS